MRSARRRAWSWISTSKLGEPDGIVSQSVPPLRLEGLGLLAEGTEEIVTGGDQRTGLGLKARLQRQLAVAVMPEGRSSLSVEGHNSPNLCRERLTNLCRSIIIIVSTIRVPF